MSTAKPNKATSVGIGDARGMANAADPAARRPAEPGTIVSGAAAEASAGDAPEPSSGSPTRTTSGTATELAGSSPPPAPTWSSSPARRSVLAVRRWERPPREPRRRRLALVPVPTPSAPSPATSTKASLSPSSQARAFVPSWGGRSSGPGPLPPPDGVGSGPMVAASPSSGSDIEVFPSKRARSAACPAHVATKMQLRILGGGDGPPAARRRAPSNKPVS